MSKLVLYINLIINELLRFYINIFDLNLKKKTK